MAATAFGALSLQQKLAWATVVSQAGRDKNFFMSNGFVGANTADMGSPIHRITELTKTERGTAAVLPLVADLQEDGQTGDNMLEGNEEALINDAIVIQIDNLRHGVRSKGKMAEQETVLRFRQLAKEKLSFWLADTIDELCFLTLSGVSYDYRTDGSLRVGSRLPDLRFAADVNAPSSARKVFAGGVSTTGALTAADRMTWQLIVQASTIAKRQRIKPIMNKGKPHYIMIMSSEQIRDLKLDKTYLEVTKNAGVRGTDNPLFNNANIVVEGIAIFDHQKVFNTLNAPAAGAWGAGGLVHGAQALMLGAQALGMATIDAAEWAEDEKDYGNRKGIAYGRMFGLVKPQFKSIYNDMTRQDFGVISIYTAAAQDYVPVV